MNITRKRTSRILIPNLPQDFPEYISPDQENQLADSDKDEDG